MDLCESRPAWSTEFSEFYDSQPGLHSETLSEKQKSSPKLLFIYLYGCIAQVHGYLQRPVEGARPLGAGVTGS